MGIRLQGTVNRSRDGHMVHANVDTDVIVAEETPLACFTKPQELYHHIEHFCLGRRRLELFGVDHNIRAGWVTVGDKVSSSNYDAETYLAFFKDGHYLKTTQEVESLRPKSPPRFGHTGH
eukprot:TRINITY_DN4433_c0_g1_i1.p1 TRINITY_DN4433_c0_g1~~TRINITY_DN4433_c0_g1_i1.p1  ORF type:complete len:120 (-),score=30.01 TRINITY_DN4433_c0_g1_i1:52-411(-)